MNDCCREEVLRERTMARHAERVRTEEAVRLAVEKEREALREATEALEVLVNHPGPCSRSHKGCAKGRAALAAIRARSLPSAPPASEGEPQWEPCPKCGANTLGTCEGDATPGPEPEEK